MIVPHGMIVVFGYGVGSPLRVPDTTCVRVGRVRIETWNGHHLFDWCRKPSISYRTGGFAGASKRRSRACLSSHSSWLDRYFVPAIDLASLAGRSPCSVIQRTSRGCKVLTYKADEERQKNINKVTQVSDREFNIYHVKML